MINFIRADIYKLSKMLSVKVCFLLCCFSAIGIAFILRGIYSGNFSNTVSTNASMLVDVMLVSLLGGILTGSFIADDFESKNIHSEIACGRGRFTIVMAKMVSYMLIIILLTLPYAVVAVIGFTTHIGFAPLVGIPSSFFDVLSNVSQVKVNGENIAKSILVCILIIYMYIARLSICIPIAFKFRKNIPVIVTGFITSFVFDIVIAFVSENKEIADIVELLPYAIVYDLNMSASATTLIKAFFSGTIFIVIMIIITYRIFRRDEIK